MFRVLCASLTLIALAHGIAAADEQANALAILDKAVAAHGGEAVLGKFVAVHSKTKGEFQGHPVRSEEYSQGPDKAREILFDEDTKETVVVVTNGKHGWVKIGSEATKAMTDSEVASQREEMHADWVSCLLVCLRAAEYRLSPLDEISVDGHKAIGILVRHDKHDDVKIYFDEKTHLLVRYERRFKEPDSRKRVKEERDFSEYRTVQGTKQPFKEQVYWDGVKVLDGEVTRFELLEKPLDDVLFAKPLP